MESNNPQQEKKVYNRELVEALESEIAQIDEASMPTLYNYLRYEISKLRNGVTDFIEIGRKCKVRAKLIIPEQNSTMIVSKIIGQGGVTLKGLQEETQTKISVLGAGSMRDRQKEQELLDTGEAKYRHFLGPLHVQIEALADASEAYYRLSHCMAEIKQYFDVVPPSPQNNNSNSFRGGAGPMRGGGGTFMGRGGGGMGGQPPVFDAQYAQDDYGFGGAEAEPAFGQYNSYDGSDGKMRGGGRGGSFGNGRGVGRGGPRGGMVGDRGRPYTRRPGRGRG